MLKRDIRKKINNNVNIEEIKAYYKQLGIIAMHRKNYNDAIKYFNLWQYAYTTYSSIDKYDYDFPLLNYIENQLSEFKITPQPVILKKNEKIRIIYLVHGILDSTSIIPKIIIDLIKYHDTTQFEIYVFITDNWALLNTKPGKIFIDQFKNIGCPIHHAPFFKYGFSKIRSIVSQMNEIKPHILITTAALADFEHFFITALKPAPIQIGFIFASPQQFISPSFDYGISWINRINSNCPTPCLNSGVIYLPEERNIPKTSKIDYGLPNDSIIMISAGRYTKFQNKQIFDIIIKTMKKLLNLHYIIVGPSSDQISSLNEILPEEIKKRIHIFKWSMEYEKYLSISDIYLDTYPSGGGITLYDAALLHLPIISFTDSNSNNFDQNDWNPAEELFVNSSIILIDRNNLPNLELAISKLYQDPDLRRNIGNDMYKSITNMRTNIDNNVKKIEYLYINLIKNKMGSS
jgi:predicted O-linked N-acetylglucosamine transferase (SPINDLY family)